MPLGVTEPSATSAHDGPFLSLGTGPDFKRVLPVGTNRTAARRCVLSPGGAPTLLDGEAKVTVVGNLGLIALLKIL